MCEEYRTLSDIVDNNGTCRIRLEGADIAVYDDGGNAVFSVACSANGANLRLRHKGSGNEAEIRVNQSGFRFYGKCEDSQSSVALEALDNSAKCKVERRRGSNSVAELGVGKGEAGLTVSDEDSGGSAALSTSTDKVTLKLQQGQGGRPPCIEAGVSRGRAALMGRNSDHSGFRLPE